MKNLLATARHFRKKLAQERDDELTDPESRFETIPSPPPEGSQKELPEPWEEEVGPETAREHGAAGELDLFSLMKEVAYKLLDRRDRYEPDDREYKIYDEIYHHFFYDVWTPLSEYER